MFILNLFFYLFGTAMKWKSEAGLISLNTTTSSVSDRISVSLFLAIILQKIQLFGVSIFCLRFSKVKSNFDPVGEGLNKLIDCLKILTFGKFIKLSKLK